MLRRKQLLRIAGICELSVKDRALVLQEADTVAASAKTSAIARNDHGNTKKERDEQAVYDRVRRQHIEVNDKFSFYTETVHCQSKVEGKPPLLQFARHLPICSCHIRTEDVIQSTRRNAKGGVETTYSLKDDALIYTPKQIWSAFLNAIVPISALESPRDRGSGFTPCAVHYKDEAVAATLLQEKTLVAMNDLYHEKCMLAAEVQLLKDELRLQKTELALEQAKTQVAKDQCAQQLADLHQSMHEGSS